MRNRCFCLFCVLSFFVVFKRCLEWSWGQRTFPELRDAAEIPTLFRSSKCGKIYRYYILDIKVYLVYFFNGSYLGVLSPLFCKSINFIYFVFFPGGVYMVFKPKLGTLIFSPVDFML